MAASTEEIEAVHTIGHTMAAALHAWMAEPRNQETVAKLAAAGVKLTEERIRASRLCTWCTCRAADGEAASARPMPIHVHFARRTAPCSCAAHDGTMPAASEPSSWIAQ